MSTTFVFDLDGVIRHWDPEIVARAEREHGLPTGSLLGEAFEPELLLQAVTGAISDEAWRQEVVARLQGVHSAADATAAVASWSESPGELIEGATAALNLAREAGPVCLLSNATTRLESDLAALGIEDAFDHVFNTARIGFAKPDDRVFAHIERELALAAEQIVYVDDGEANVRAAAGRGWTSLLAGPNTRLTDLLAPHLR